MKSIYLILDMQNDLVQAEGPNGKSPLGEQVRSRRVLTKHRVSPFYSTTLMAQLSAARIERIYCSGVSTQAVVQATVRDGHDRDFDMVVIEDACCAHSEEEHRNSIGSIGRFCRTVTSATVDFKS